MEYREIIFKKTFMEFNLLQILGETNTLRSILRSIADESDNPKYHKRNIKLLLKLSPQILFCRIIAFSSNIY
jgi:hypothetical protein